MSPNQKGQEKGNKKWVMTTDISAWWNPVSGDFAWLYINRVINRSITHSKGDSCHIKWQDTEHRSSYVSLLRGHFPHVCACACVCCVCAWEHDWEDRSLHVPSQAQYRGQLLQIHHSAGWKPHSEGLSSAAGCPFIVKCWRNCVCIMTVSNRFSGRWV